MRDGEDDTRMRNPHGGPFGDVGVDDAGRELAVRVSDRLRVELRGQGDLLQERKDSFDLALQVFLVLFVTMFRESHSLKFSAPLACLHRRADNVLIAVVMAIL